MIYPKRLIEVDLAIKRLSPMRAGRSQFDTATSQRCTFGGRGGLLRHVVQLSAPPSGQTLLIRSAPPTAKRPAQKCRKGHPTRDRNSSGQKVASGSTWQGKNPPCS